MASTLRFLVYFLASTLLVLFLLPVVDPSSRIEMFVINRWHKMLGHRFENISYPAEICPCNTDESPWTFYRVQFGSKPGVTVYGWPAKGGLYVLRHCTGLELDFLGLSRFEDKVRPGYDPHTGRPLFTTLNGSIPLNPEQEQEQKERDEEEERHCNKMRMLGASWYKSADALREEWLEQKVFIPRLDTGNMPYIKTCWPSSGKGVWVLNTTRSRAAELGAGRIYNARDMDERCRIIESVGGMFYSDPKESALDLP